MALSRPKRGFESRWGRHTLGKASRVNSPLKSSRCPRASHQPASRCRRERHAPLQQRTTRSAWRASDRRAAPDATTLPASGVHRAHGPRLTPAVAALTASRRVEPRAPHGVSRAPGAPAAARLIGLLQQSPATSLDRSCSTVANSRSTSAIRSVRCLALEQPQRFINRLFQHPQVEDVIEQASMTMPSASIIGISVSVRADTVRPRLWYRAQP